jgi:hypothetical protein
MSGTVNISRDLFDHPAFKSAPFSEREAWLWIIMEASWKPRQKRIGHIVVNVGRGQLAASIRFMADAWGWTAAKVQRFIERLKKLEMIRVETDTGLTLLTLCNYDKFQASSKASDTGPIHLRYTSDTNEKKGVIREEGKEREVNLSRPIDEIAECIAHFNATAERAGWAQVQKVTPSRRAALVHRIGDCGGAEAWREAIARAAASPLLTGQTGRGWRADFDWLCKAANFTKLMEGNYDPRPHNGKGTAHQRRPSGPHDSMVAAFAYVAGRDPH